MPSPSFSIWRPYTLYLYTMPCHLIVTFSCLSLPQGVRFDPDLPQTIRLEFAKSNTKVNKPKQQSSPPAAATHPALAVHPLTGRKHQLQQQHSLQQHQHQTHQHHHHHPGAIQASHLTHPFPYGGSALLTSSYAQFIQWGSEPSDRRRGPPVPPPYPTPLW